MKRITLFFLSISLLGSIFALLTIGLSLPSSIPLTPIVTLSSFMFTLFHAGQREGWKRMPLLVALIIAAGLFFESLGVATGLVYGPYHYTNQLGPKFLGLVPYLIPVAWTMMIYPSLVIAEVTVPETWSGLKRGLAVAALSGLIMTAWDVAMDPMMVQGGNWVWELQGGYFGVPLQNFWGWWLTTFTAIGIYLLVTRKQRRPTGSIPDRWAIQLYTINCVSTLLSCLIVGLSGPALAGIFAMLPWILAGWVKTKTSMDLIKGGQNVPYDA